MHIECIKHVLYVVDMDRAIRFYRDAVGLTVKMQSPGWSEVTRGDTILGLHAGSDGKARETGLSFQVTDIEVACAELCQTGATLIDPPESRPGEPIRLARIADTEGNVLMLTQYRGLC